MKNKRTYRAVNVQQVVPTALLALLPATMVVVGIDVAKVELAASFSEPGGVCRYLVRFKHPMQTVPFMDLLVDLVKSGKQVQVAMEPTGTYGDALCEQLHRRQIEVYLVSPKKTHDAAELFDGVPSQHDNKDATLVARLHAQGLSKRWQPQEPERRNLRALVTRREIYADALERLQGKLEPLLARHWPEVGRVLDFRKSSSAVKLLIAYPDPARVKADPGGVMELLRRESRGNMALPTRQAVVEAAKETLGVPLVAQEQGLIQELGEELLRQSQQVERMDKLIKEALEEQGPGLGALTTMLGATTTAVMVSMMGNPATYGSAGALEKGCGLNLKESSSGRDQNRGIHITKRGPALVRKYLYLATLRWINADPVARAWYSKRAGYTEQSKMRAVIALNRKLVKAIWHVAQGTPYEASRLFDLRRLKLESKGEGPQVAHGAQGEQRGNATA